MAMNPEIRIYFESLEQCAHFIYPVVKDIASKFQNIEIKMVKLKKNYEFYSKKVAPIIFWKEPDILITIVKESEEYPILIVEFSNAVFTEDHELQRFDGLIASAENNCFYAKISPLNKVSSNEHGGNIGFDYVKPYALIFHKFNIVFFHFDWRVDKNGFVEVDKNFLSCPNRILEFEKFLSVVLNAALNTDSTDYIEQTKKELINYKPFKEWQMQLSDYKIEKNIHLKTSRTKWNDEIKTLELKINRFGHAMDPERGMLAFYGTMTDVISKMSFTQNNDAWYKDIPKESGIRDYINKNSLKKPFDFLYCFMLGSGLHSNKEFISIAKNYEKNKNQNIEIDISYFAKNNFSQLNKALRTILKYSKIFIITDENDIPRVTLKWKDIEILKDFDKNPRITPIDNILSLDEDAVTYITIHNVLKLNKFKILAASYPGAQADRVILIQPGTGRRQKRKYVDIIAYLPEKNITSLQENKGVFSALLAQEDIDELSKYKNNEEYKNALNLFQKRVAPESTKDAIKIGIGFWSNYNFSISKIKDLNMKDLDYFVYIDSDMKTWNIWRTGKNNIFNTTEGKVILPHFFEIKGNSDNSIKLSKFIVNKEFLV